MSGQFFDATQYQPDQGGSAHPIGKFQAFVSATDIKPTKDNDGHYFELEWTTQQGKIAQRFNLWNQSQVAMDIAHKQLSAVCYATNVHRLNMQNKGAELLNARATIEVRQQKSNANYVEIGYVYSLDGRDPRDIAKGGVATAPAAAPAAPAATQPAAAPPVAAAPAAPPWPKEAAPAAPAATQPAAQPAAWSPGGGMPEAKAPWAT